MQDSDFPNLPKSWQVKTLGEVCEINPKNKLDDNLEVSFIPMNLILDKFQNKFSYETKIWKNIKKGYTHLQNNCIALAKITPCFENGKCVVLDDLKNGYGAGTTEIIILLPNTQKVFIKYIFYFLNTQNFIEQGKRNFKGTAGQLRISTDFVSNCKIPIPPLEIQRRIVKRLDEAFSRIENGTKHLKSAKDNLIKYKQSLLKSAFNGTLTNDSPLSQGESTHLTHPLAPSAREGEQEDCHALKSPLPQHEGHLGVGSTHTHRVVDCHESANADSRNDENSPSFAGGQSSSPSLNTSGLSSLSPSLADCTFLIPPPSAEGARGWVNAHNGESANLPQGWTIKTLGEVCEKISAGGDRPNDCTAEKTQENQIPIFSNGIENNGLYGYTKTPTITKPALTISARGTIGFVCVRYEPFFPIVRLICAIPNDKVLVLEFLAYALRYLIPQGEGSSIPQLTIPNFKQIKIPIPPLETQRQIVAILERHFTSADKVSAYIESCLSKAKQLKSSLLKSAFDGTLTNETTHPLAPSLCGGGWGWAKTQRADFAPIYERAKQKG